MTNLKWELRIIAAALVVLAAEGLAPSAIAQPSPADPTEFRKGVALLAQGLQNIAVQLQQLTTVARDR